MAVLETIAINAIPSIIGLFGGGKKRKQVQPVEQKPYASELETQYQGFADLLKGLIEGGTAPLVDYGAMDYGPTELNATGQEAIAGLKGAKPTYGYLPEETSASSWLNRLMNGDIGNELRASATAAEKMGSDLANRVLAGQTEKLRGQYARGGNLYGSAPISAQETAAADIGTQLGNAAAERRIGIENTLLGAQQQGVSQLGSLAGQRTSRGLNENQQLLQSLGQILGSSQYEATLQSEAARRKQDQINAQQQWPLELITGLANIFRASAPSSSNTYYPQSEPSGAAQIAGSLSNVLPGLYDAYKNFYGGGNTSASPTYWYDSSGNKYQF